jgi:hypothetical protein
MKQNNKPTPFFSDLEPWKKEWQSMPEFIQEDLEPFQSILVHFETEEDRIEFSKLVNQKITSKTRFIWFPKVERANLLKEICTDES